MFGNELIKPFIDKFRDRKVLVYGDPDVDGLFSLYLVCELLHMQGIQYTYYINNKRRHGFDLEPSSLKGFFVIAVDFDITADMVASLVSNDVALLSLDHHDIQDEFIYYKSSKTDAEGVVLNNQYPFEPEENRYLSGAGVVYEAFREAYPEFRDRDREAIVGITLLSDARPIENNKAKFYLTRTYASDTQSGYLGYLVKNTLESDYGFGVPKLDRSFIDFTFSPRVNSLLRFGKEAEAINFILGNGLSETNTRKIQKDYIAYLMSIAETFDYPSLRVVCCDVTKIKPEYRDVDISCFIGVVCSKSKGVAGNAIAYVLDNGVVTRASFRGKYSDIHYRLALKNLGIRAEGHPSAFGLLGLDVSEDTLTQVSDIVYELELDHEVTYTVIETSNLSIVMLQKGNAIANENCYVRDLYRTYIRYTGNNVRITVDKEKYREYLVDGRAIKCFDNTLNPSNALILPMMEKGHITLYLQSDIDAEVDEWP